MHIIFNRIDLRRVSSIDMAKNASAIPVIDYESEDSQVKNNSNLNIDNKINISDSISSISSADNDSSG